MQTALPNPWSSGDTRDQDILKELDGALQFIHDAKTGDERHHVLVNCAQGVSRSASVTIAYLMKSPWRIDVEYEKTTGVTRSQGLAA